MSDKIFDLEQQIMNAWNVVDDIDMLYTYFGDDPTFAGLSAQAEDEMMNLLLGVKSMYALKFEKLFETFEEVCREHHRRGNLITELEEKVRVLSNEREPFDDDRMDIIGQNGNDGLHYESTTRFSIDDATSKEWDEMARQYYQYYKGDK